ncbi:MAG TPA: hypothetical protein VGY48_15130 [Vicinamibacterales bacterium]|nr:hypothetical protein [Vicinamibacterales bacterium]
MLTRNDQGSIPELVMRTGIIRTMNPSHARQDIDAQHVLNVTSAHGISTEYDQPVAQPSATQQAVAATVVATPPIPVPPPPAPPGMHGVMLGATASGQPVAAFQIDAAPQPHQAQGAVMALRKAASDLQKFGHGSLPPELIGGPLAALMRGGAIELHFKNGVVTRTAL